MLEFIYVSGLGYSLRLTYAIGFSIPMSEARPTLDQPPVVVNVKIVSWTVPLGARTHNGIAIAKSPAKCRTSRAPSMSGRRFAKKVLKRVAKRRTAMVNIVPCQDLGT